MIPAILRCHKVARVFCSAISLTLTSGYFGATPLIVSAAKANLPFAALKPDVDLDIEDGEFELTISFTLNPQSNGINPHMDPLSLRLNGGSAAFSITIPAGSLKKEENGQFTFQGTIDKVKMLASIRTLRDGTFEFEIQGDHVNLRGVANPVTVSLTIGDDGGGSTSVRAKIE